MYQTDREVTEAYETALEQLNREYLALQNSREYLRGKQVIKYLDAIRKLDAAAVIKMIRRKRFYDRAGRLFTDKVREPERESQAIQASADTGDDRKITIYTCVLGEYDTPRFPLIRLNNYSYVLYTDQERRKEHEGWEVRSIPEHVKALGNRSSINRYLKFHPKEFCDGDYSIYIDGNVRFITSGNDFLKNLTEKTGLAMFDHPFRTCLYREAETCLYLGKGNAEKIKEQMQTYQEQGMPKDYGLKEATVIAADLKREEGLLLLHRWWEEYERSGSGRDQLALPYVMWKSGLAMSAIASLGPDIRTDPHLQIAYHNRPGAHGHEK